MKFVGFAKSAVILIVLLVFSSGAAFGFTPTPKIGSGGFTIEEKIKEAEKKLEKVKIKHAWKYDKEKKAYVPSLASHEETRIVFGETFVRKIAYYSWAEIALAILDLSTGKIEIIKVKRAGPDLIAADKNFEIEIEKRFSGMAWNGYNTPFLVKKPENRVVIANKYITYRWGKPLRIVVYSPYSSKIHRAELVKKGEDYLDAKIEEAYAELKKLKVKSAAFPDKLAADVISKNWIKTLMLIEHIDPDEFLNFPDDGKKRIAERVFVILGLNGKKAFSLTTSNRGAQGLAQFIEPTYQSIRKKYPKAKLNYGFVSGTADHKNIIKAAILLLDYNLSDIKRKFGDEILKDVLLEEYLAASYNTTVARTLKYIETKNSDEYLPETRIYLKKFNYYKNNK